MSASYCFRCHIRLPDSSFPGGKYDWDQQPPTLCMFCSKTHHIFYDFADSIPIKLRLNHNNCLTKPLKKPDNQKRVHS